MSQTDEVEVTTGELCAALAELNERLNRFEKILLLPFAETVEGEPPSFSVRIDALEKALQFAMANIQVTIREESPIIGGGARQQTMTMLNFFLAQAQQQKMLVGQTNGQQQQQP